MNEPFAVQVAATKAPGGIETAVLAYDAMFRAVGVETICLYRGPDAARLGGAGVALHDLPDLALSPLGRLPGLLGGVADRIRNAAGGRELFFIIHSDRALPALRRLFPQARFAAPCHSDKFKGKRQADIAVTLNARQQSLAETALSGSPCRPVQLGNPFTCRSRAIAGDGPTRLVFCARLTPVKDPLTLIRAHQALTDPPELLIIGDGPLMAEARQAAERSAGRIRFAGWQPDPWAGMTKGDILVTPSSWEGLPYLLLEALDHGVPVIASDIAGHRAALADGAYGDIFALGDDEALISALKRAIADPSALRAKAKAGQESLPGRFGPAAFWRNLQKALMEETV